MNQKKYSKTVATNIVIANMIGTGIFTSIGFQVLPNGIPDVFTIMLIWFLGGVLSLCGATAYAEVATTFNDSGGEYIFLKKLYHPVLGFASGWVSIIVGFSAAIASLSLAAGAYLDPITKNYLSYENSDKVIAFFLLILVTGIQLTGIKSSGYFQNIITYIKLFFILILISLPFFLLDNSLKPDVSFLPTKDSIRTTFSLEFAGSLVFVMFAYSGWNASAYITGTLENPKKNLPFSLITGTLIVTIVYLILTGVYMYTCSFEELANQVDVGNLVVEKVLGKETSKFFGVFFALALIAGINAMYIAGPRVAEKMGKDHKVFSSLGKLSKNNVPSNSIFLFTLISTLLIVFSSFKEIVEYIGLTLSFFSTFVVFGVFIIRGKKLNSNSTVKTWGYPITPIIFLAINIWMITYFILVDPIRILWSLLTIIPAIFIFYFSNGFKI